MYQGYDIWKKRKANCTSSHHIFEVKGLNIEYSDIIAQKRPNRPNSKSGVAVRVFTLSRKKKATQNIRFLMAHGA